MDQEITGTLKNAVWDMVYNVVWGNVYDDVRGRFPDGTWIHTSHTQAEYPTKPDVIHTLNSTYAVEWADEA